MEALNKLSPDTAAIAGLIEYAAAFNTIPGEVDCGDRYLVTPTPAGTLVAVVDGLGHGEQAAEASEVAIATLRRHAEESVVGLIRRCHDAMKHTRGAVMSLASFSARDQTVTWLSVGNVGGVLLHQNCVGGAPCETILMRGGVVGFSLPALQTAVVRIKPRDVLIFATDGIRCGFELGLSLNVPLQEIANSIRVHHNKGTDDALVLVARYRGDSS